MLIHGELGRALITRILNVTVLITHGSSISWGPHPSSQRLLVAFMPVLGTPEVPRWGAAFEQVLRPDVGRKFGPKRWRMRYQLHHSLHWLPIQPLPAMDEHLEHIPDVGVCIRCSLANPGQVAVMDVMDDGGSIDGFMDGMGLAEHWGA